ncbi:MAG TPA: alpha/beta hydrolase [Solirubrobacterales bacterium]
MPPAEPVAFEVGSWPTIRGEAAGEGAPTVLCHGLTATRRYVVHGSRVLERSGNRLLTYDARGHGGSDPAPGGRGYGYPELAADLGAVIDAEAGSGPLTIGGHSMGAHTALAYALANPERVARLVVIGPVYADEIDEDGLGYWDGLAEALENGGTDGFVDYIDRHTETDPAWRDSVLRFTRERISRHSHLDAVAQALREVPRSRPFGDLAELEALEMPALVVASGDDADPGHPRAVAEEYARRLPRGRLLAEEEGASPLAWQGGRLSREIAAFCAEGRETQE